MANIGESKTKGLFSHFKGLQSGSVGSFNTQRDWNDIPQNSRGAYTAPLIKKEIMQDSQADPTLSTTVLNPVTHRLEDVARITKLIGTPQGIKWEAHMAELQTLQNQLEMKRSGKTYKKKDGETDRGAFGTLMINAGKSLLTGIGLTASTLAQVAVGGHLGEHQTPFLGRSYLRQGKDGDVLESLIDALGIVDGNNINGGRLALNGAEIIGRPIQTLVAPEVGHQYRRDGNNSRFTGSKYSVVSPWDLRIGKDSQERHVGEGKNFGTTYTPGITYEDEMKYEETIYPSSSISSKGVRNGRTGNPYSLSGSEPNRNVERSGYPKQGLQLSPVVSGESRDEYVKEGTKEQYGSQSVHAERYEDQNGDTYSYDWSGQVTRSERSYLKNRTTSPNTIVRNYQGATDASTTGSYDRFGEPDVQLQESIEEFSKFFDLIPFFICSITPDNRYYLYFQANLESFKDDFTGNWNDTSYLGRAEKFHTYSGFDRQISFSFKVVARRRDDLVPIYKKLNMLAGTTAPTYAADKAFMRGTLTQVTIGDYLINQYGFFKSVGFQWENDVPWEIGIDENGEKTEIIRVPHMLTVSVNFTPIHDFNVNAVTDAYFAFPRKAAESVISPGENKNTEQLASSEIKEPIVFGKQSAKNVWDPDNILATPENDWSMNWRTSQRANYVEL